MNYSAAKDPAPAVPVQEGSPWPLFRRDGRNTGFLPITPLTAAGGVREKAGTRSGGASAAEALAYRHTGTRDVQSGGGAEGAGSAAETQGGGAASRPWEFHTDKGIFSTPVIDKDENIYFGSADRRFYALSASGALLWTFATGEIIDSAACIAAFDPEHNCCPLTILSGDGCMYRLRPEAGDRGRRRAKPGGCETQQDERVIWTFRVRDESGESFNDWWEGNAVIGPDGCIYAGNTNFNYYAVTPGGRMKWRYRTGSNNWSAAAFASDRIFWASNDTAVRAVGYGGNELWRRRTKGIIAASAALGADGTVYIGSFDGSFYALDPRTGRVRWKFRTEDHIYSSAAVLPPISEGGSETVCFGSADGRIYALDSRGRLKWSYDTGAPVRSSPAAGFAPDGRGTVVYAGCGNGRLYALDGETGRRRWSFDTTPADPLLRVRNDLNGSPALGRNGVYIGGEHGRLVFVPYDYPLYAADDPRCCTDGGEELPPDCLRLVPVDAGGTIVKDCLYHTNATFCKEKRPVSGAAAPAHAGSRQQGQTEGGSIGEKGSEAPITVPAEEILSFRLIARQGGKSLPYRLINRLFRTRDLGVRLQSDKDIPFRLRTSGSGLYLHCIPEQRLPSGMRFRLRLNAVCVSGGVRFGNLKLGGRRRAVIIEDYRFETPPPPADPPRIRPGGTANVYEWRRLAVPFPSMMPSLNQIGFDTYHWLLGTAAVREEGNGRGRLLFWVCGARPDEDGRLSVSSERSYLFPLSGCYSEGAFTASCSNFSMLITGIPVPFNRMEMRSRLPENGGLPAGGNITAESRIWKIPNFGVKMVAAGLAGTGMRTLFSRGSFILQHVKAQPPDGISTGRIRKEGRRVRVSVERPERTAFPASRHFVSIVLYRADSLQALSLDYRTLIENTKDAEGNIREAVLTLPEDLRPAAGLLCTVMIDVFPAATIRWEDL